MPRSGPCPDSAQHTFWVYLSMRNSKALDAAIAAVSNPASADYGKYLTPDRFRASYAPTDANVAAVRAWLKQAGFAVSADRPDNNRWVKVTGTTAQVERAFSTQLRTYQHRGKTLQAPNGDLSIARSISSRVAGVAGLDGSDRLMKPRATSPTRTRARRSSTPRRARRLGARSRPSTTRATRSSRPPTASSSCRTRRAATHRASCRAPTA